MQFHNYYANSSQALWDIWLDLKVQRMIWIKESLVVSSRELDFQKNKCTSFDANFYNRKVTVLAKAS